MLFFIGFTLMVLNEGFVILRHAVPYLAELRLKLIQRYGSKWQITHSILDILWVVLIALAFILDLHKWKTYLTWILGFWIFVGVFYLTVFWDKIFKK